MVRPRQGWKGIIGGAVLCAALAGCEYGYSRSALMVESGYPPAPPPRSYVGYGYEAYGSPWGWSFSYAFGSPYPYYSRPYYSVYAPYYYYAPFYPYTPYVYVPYSVSPAPRRTIRLAPGSGSPKPSAPSSGSSRRRLNLP